MKFFQIIDNSFIGRFVDKRLDLIAATDPERIYVENIRSFYNLTSPIAKGFCEMAVKERLFQKWIAIECPQCDTTIKTLPVEETLPEKFICFHCQQLEKEKYEFSQAEYHLTSFYKLNKREL